MEKQIRCDGQVERDEINISEMPLHMLKTKTFHSLLAYKVKKLKMMEQHTNTCKKKKLINCNYVV